MLKSHYSSTPSKRRLVMHLGSFRARLTFLAGVFLVAGLPRPAAAEVSWRPLGEETAVNVQTYGSQSHPAAAIDAAGNVFVVWMDHQRWGIRGRVYDAAGLPVTGEIRISANVFEVGLDAQPRVAALGNGDFIVVWRGDSGGGFRLRRFNALGQPLSDTISIYDVPLETVFDPDVAADPAGGFVLTWISSSSSFRVLAQRFDADGAPRSGAFFVSSENDGRKTRPRVAVDPASGSFLIVWIDDRETENPDVWARRFTSSGQPQGPEFLVNIEKSGEALGAVPVFHGGGSSVVWSNQDPQWEIVAQRFDGAGTRVGPAVLLSGAPGFYSLYPAPAVAVAPGGGLLVLWAGPDPRGADPYEFVPNAAVMGRLFDDSWQPASAPFEVNTYVPWSQTEPAVVVDGQGRFSAFWGSGEELYYPTSPPRDPRGQDGDGFGVYGQRFALTGCTPGDDHLCLGNRFEVRATWKNPYTGETGIAHGHPLTADTGALWFFDPANLELMVKVLDGRAINGSFWVFYGALSNVEYTLTVTDTATGAERTYHNAPLQYASRSDTSAFPDTGSASLSKAAAPAAPVEISSKAPCVPSATVLCLGGGRFAAEVVWTDPRTGLAAQGRALPLTADTGSFWFLDAANLELMIKVLDGRGINGRFWVFFGALSDLEYTVTVTDRETGKQRTYHNDRHQLASRADTAAF
jgi:hypothetical protein